MSRELLKRALDFLTDADYEVGINWDRDKYVALINNIETYLARPEPEPVGWLYDFQSDNGIVHNWFTPDEAEIEQSHALNIRPLYTSQPDQSARIAELIAQRNVHEEIIKTAYARCKELEQQLAALQAKIEGGVRVYAFGMDDCIRATSKINASNAVLILDEGVEI